MKRSRKDICHLEEEAIGHENGCHSQKFRFMPIKFSQIIAQEVEENQEILPFATRVNVNWKVGLKTEKKTKTFHKNAGSKITVEASVFPTKKIRIGIVAKSIGRMYVETTDMAKKTFNIKKTGEYSVFVTNKSDSTIHVVGNYTK